MLKLTYEEKKVVLHNYSKYCHSFVDIVKEREYQQRNRVSYLWWLEIVNHLKKSD